MTAIVSPVRYDRLQAALVSVLGEATGAEVTFAYGSGVWEAAPDELIDLRVIVGPREREYQRRRFDFFPPTLIEIAIDSAVEDQRYLVDVNEHGFYYDADDADDEADIRDGLIAALAGETLFTASASGANVRLVPDTPAGIWQLALHGPMSLDTLTLDTDAARLYEGTQTITVQADCFSKSTSPRAGAWDLASRARAAFMRQDVIDALEAAEISIRTIGAGIDISDQSGASWRSRVAFDIEIDLPAMFAAPIDRVTSIDYQGIPSFTLSV